MPCLAWSQVADAALVLQTLLTALKQLMFALSCYGSKTHARAGVPAAPQQVCDTRSLSEPHGGIDSCE